MLVNITPANVLSWVSIIVNILAIEVSIIKSDSVSTIIPISVIAPFTKSEWKPINHNKSLILNDLKSFRKDVELN